MEWGCGHGRDANYFRKKGHIVYAYDTSANAIALAREKFGRKGLKFYCKRLLSEPGDVGILGVRMVNATYARWFLHCLPPGKGEEALTKMYQFTKAPGYIMLEYKTEKTKEGSIYNTEHTRVPINSGGLITFGQNLGMRLVYHREGYGLSIMGDHDPYLARTIFKKVK